MGEDSGQVDPRIAKALEEVLQGLPALLSRFGDRLFRLTGRFDELCQEVGLAAKKSLPKFQPGEDLHDSLRAWVFAIAKHKYIDLQKQADRLVQSIQDEVLEQAVRDGLTPSRVLRVEEGIERLNECVLKLNPGDRQLLVLRVLDRRPRQEVADDAQMSTAALDRRIRRVLQELRDCWGSSGAYRFVVTGQA